MQLCYQGKKYHDRYFANISYCICSIIKYGNIQINDNIKLNEQAVCLEDNKTYFAKDLVLDGLNQPSGYTEPILHKRRLEFKSKD